MADTDGPRRLSSGLTPTVTSSCSRPLLVVMWLVSVWRARQDRVSV